MLYIYIYIYSNSSVILFVVIFSHFATLRRRRVPHVGLHSAKGGAVETGCSDLYDVIY